MSDSQRNVQDDVIAQEVYAFIVAFIAERSFSPTQREIAEGCCIAVGTVSKRLKRLEAANRIVRRHNHARNIELLPKPDQT